MDRRTLLKTGGMAALGFGIAGCATRVMRPTRPAFTLAPIRASWDRVIRTTVGLRPHRPSGFVLRVEKFDSQTVIHNYGHGGAGLSLSWGTGAMAADFAVEAAQSNPTRCRRSWVRRGRLGHGETAPAPRFRRHDLRKGDSARHHDEQGLGRFYANFRARSRSELYAGVGSTV